MKGIRCFIKSRKFYIIFALLFVPFFILSNTISVFALAKDYSNMALRLRYSSGSDYVSSGPIYYGISNGVTDVKYVDRVAVGVSVDSSTSSNSFMTVTAKYNLVSYTTDPDGRPYNTSSAPFIYDVVLNGTSGYNAESATVSVYNTDWVLNITGTPYPFYCRTFTYEVTFIVRNIPSSISTLSWGVEYPGRLQSSTSTPVNYYFEYDANNFAQIDFTSDYNSSIMQQQVQQQNVTNNYLAEQAAQDHQDREDLQNQVTDTSDDASGAASSVTSGFSSLTSVISGFVNIILHPPASDCVIDADMGNMDLGDIDLCQLDPPPAIQVIATLLFIGFTIPFAYSLIMFLLNLLGDITEGS